MNNKFDVDIVKTGEDDVARVDIEVGGAEAISVLEFPLKVTETRDVLSGVRRLCRRRRGSDDLW